MLTFIFVIAWEGVECVGSGLESQALRTEYVKTLGHSLAISVKQSMMPSPRPPALRGSLVGHSGAPAHVHTLSLLVLSLIICRRTLEAMLFWRGHQGDSGWQLVELGSVLPSPWPWG